MSREDKAQPAESQTQTAQHGVATALSGEAIRTLTGYFDTLIQMDLAQKKCNEQRNASDHKRDTDNNGEIT